MWLPDPTWGNHHGIFGSLGYEIKKYPYFDATTRGLAFDRLIGALRTANRGDVVLLHACAHNPTGVDPTREQWHAIAQVVRERGLYPFFDCAYQGFASGDLDNDAYAIRYFIKQGFDLLVCQSFSKNFGLYGERCGCLHIVSGSTEVAKAVKTQLEKISREEISNPAAYGARIVRTVLNSDELFAQWVVDFRSMAQRIILMRKELRSKLEALATPGTWDHITSQIGMFSFTGLSKEQVDRLVNEFHIYLISNGRISMAGLNSHNVDYVARAINTVVRDSATPNM
jgi:aspartate aminotransferase